MIFETESREIALALAEKINLFWLTHVGLTINYKLNKRNWLHLKQPEDYILYLIHAWWQDITDYD